jgi:hypothetical protein
MDDGRKAQLSTSLLMLMSDKEGLGISVIRQPPSCVSWHGIIVPGLGNNGFLVSIVYGEERISITVNLFRSI